MEIRIATKRDVEDILAVFESARSFMRESGNPTQWADGYPSRLTVTQDVMRGAQFVCTDGDRIVGCFSFLPGPERNYLKIEGRPWLNDVPYFVVHRLATLEQGAGVGSFMVDWICAAANNVRTDTHEANVPMRGLLEKHGFVSCGTIRVEDGTPRIAYHYARPDERTTDRGGLLSWLPWRHTGIGR
jgi:RimJ/RimL family protein N-acetyltransferase